MAYTNSAYLHNITGGDPQTIREIIDLFIEQVPEFITNLNNHLNENNFIELGKEAHKAKSSVMIMGMDDLGHDLKSLQIATINKTKEDTYAEHVSRFEVQCQIAVEELKLELLKLK